MSSAKGKPGEGRKALSRRMTQPHLCEGCKDVELPPSSLRYCVDCRKLLARVLT